MRRAVLTSSGQLEGGFLGRPEVGREKDSGAVGGQPREFHLKLWLEAGFRGGRADGRLESPQAAIELAADLQKAGVIQPEQLGM